jgi:hypothetical protein
MECPTSYIDDEDGVNARDLQRGLRLGADIPRSRDTHSQAATCVKLSNYGKRDQ